MGVRSNGVLYLPVFVCEGAHRPIRVAAENGRYGGYPPISIRNIDTIESYYTAACDRDSSWGMYDSLYQHDDTDDISLVCYLGPSGLVTREEVEGGI